MPRGRHKQHKGRAKHYLNPEEVREQEEKKKREEEWKRKKGMVGDQPEKEEGEGEEEESGSDGEGGAMGGAIRTRPSPGDLPPSDEESSDEDSDSQLQRDKTKGVEGLIDIANPNRVVKKTKKAGDIDINARVELSRKEREEIERQRDASAYRRLHEAGRTEEARRDLARLAIIKQQREKAARKKEAEREAKETQAAKERKKK